MGSACLEPGVLAVTEGAEAVDRALTGAHLVVQPEELPWPAHDAGFDVVDAPADVRAALPSTVEREDLEL